MQIMMGNILFKISDNVNNEIVKCILMRKVENNTISTTKWRCAHSTKVSGVVMLYYVTSGLLGYITDMNYVRQESHNQNKLLCSFE